MAKFRFNQIAKESRSTYKGSLQNIPIVGLEHIEPYDMLLNRYDVNVETTFTKGFKQGQILFGRRRAYQHKACVATCDGVCSGDITLIEPVEGMVYPDLLPFIVQNDEFFEHAIKGSNGALSPRVKWEHMALFEVDLPSLEEQKQLAEKLWAAYEVKQSYLKMIAATDEMVKSQFIEMFGNPITNSKAYPTKKLSEIAPESPSKHNVSGIIWNLNLDMIESNSGNVIKKIYSDKDELLSVSQFDEGNVLYSKLRPYLNKVVIPDEVGYGTTELVPLRPNTNFITSVFLANLLRGDDFVKYANTIATGTKMPRIPMNSLRQFNCILPPIEEQNQFAYIVEQADKSKKGSLLLSMAS